MDKYIKSFLKLDNLYGKKLIVILYYASLVMAAGNFVYLFVSSIVLMAQGGAMILNGIWRLLTSPFVFAFYILIIRVVCELLLIIFSRNSEQ